MDAVLQQLATVQCSSLPERHGRAHAPCPPQLCSSSSGCMCQSAGCSWEAEPPGGVQAARNTDAIKKREEALLPVYRQVRPTAWDMAPAAGLCHSPLGAKGPAACALHGLSPLVKAPKRSLLQGRRAWPCTGG